MSSTVVTGDTIWNRRFILLCITNILMMAAFYAAVPIIPVYCQEIQITGIGVGIIITAMSVTTVLFRPVAGYLLDNFNRYHVFVLCLALFCLSFFGFAVFQIFLILVLIRLYMGVVFSVCGSATVTLAGDVLPKNKIREGINRFALTVSLGMAVGSFVGITVQNIFGSQAAFFLLFGVALVALFCVLLCRIEYPKVERKPFSLRAAFYRPAFPFLVNMIFIMIPYGAVVAYAALFAQEKGMTEVTPYFYVFLVAGMLVSKFLTQKMVDARKHTPLIILSLIVLSIIMVSYLYLASPVHLILAGFFFGTGYGILQPVFQSLVTSTAAPEARGTANATYLLSYDIGIGIGAFLMGIFQAGAGLSIGFAVTAAAYAVGMILYIGYVNGYYWRISGKSSA